MLDVSFYQSAHNWVWGSAIPLWWDRGIDWKHGGFVEALTPDGRDAGLDYKRTRVACRQTYVFSHAMLLGWRDAEKAVRHGVEHITGPAWLGEGKGFARSVDRNGSVVDKTPDLYDHAFVLFALAWAYRATGDEDLKEWMHKVQDCTDVCLAHPSGRGFWNDAQKQGWRQQNPHMHLLEAALAAFEFTREPRFAELGKSLTDLFLNAFFDSERGVLPEFFDNDWKPASDAQGKITEPGHQFEWAWILGRCNALLGKDTLNVAHTLIATADRYGVIGDVTVNAVGRDGQLLDGASRTWPHTERIKAAAMLSDLGVGAPEETFASCCRVLFQRHLHTKIPGLWVERFMADGTPVPGSVPASSLYHLFLGFSELIRVGKQRGFLSEPSVLEKA